MSAQDLVTSIVNQALTIGAQKSDAATSYANQAIEASQGFAAGNPQQISFRPSAVEPAVYIPTSASGVDSTLYASTYDKIVHDLSTQFASFFTTYFPNEDAEINDALAWITKALTTGGTGLSAQVEDQIWQRDRARVLQEVSRASEDTLALFASRRFPVPPGAAQHQVYLAQQAAQDKIAQASRDTAIKQIELEVENIRFAVTQAVDFRIKSVAAAAEYIRALALGPEIASRLAISAVNAQASLITAASSYYNARIRVEEIKLDVQKTNAIQMNEMQKSDIHEFGMRLNAQAGTLSAAATAAGNMAAAALNAVHGSAAIAVQGEVTS